MKMMRLSSLLLFLNLLIFSPLPASLEELVDYYGWDSLGGGWYNGGELGPVYPDTGDAEVGEYWVWVSILERWLYFYPHFPSWDIAYDEGLQSWLGTTTQGSSAIFPWVYVFDNRLIIDKAIEAGRISEGQIPDSDLAAHWIYFLAYADTEHTDLYEPREIASANSLIGNLNIGGDNPGPTDWIDVLVAESVPSSDYTSYVANILRLAPMAEQVHIRAAPIIDVADPDTIALHVNVIAALRAAYPDGGFEIGFHPDNSTGDASAWGTPSSGLTQWQYVLSRSVEFMNNINAALASSHPGVRGYDIFSIEQSSVEPMTVSTDPTVSGSIAQVKAILQGSQAIPGVTVANPVVKFGYVGPSYGAAEEYGTSMLDYGYPQYYNREHNLSGDEFSGTYNLLANGPNSSPYFPASTVSGVVPPSSVGHYSVVDADTPNSYAQPKLPNFVASNPALTVYSQGTTPSSAQEIADYINITARYVAYIFANAQLNNNPNPDISPQTATVYLSLSGESDFLGDPVWTFENLGTLYEQILSNLNWLKSFNPALYGDIDTSQIKFSIWNFEAIIVNNIPEEGAD